MGRRTSPRPLVGGAWASLATACSCVPLPNLGIASLSLKTAIKICELLRCEDPKQEEFKSALQNLADEPVSDADIGKGKGLMISKGTAFTTSHRHYSHMIGCWNTGV